MFGKTLDLGNPVSDSPLNQGLYTWWLGLPGRSGGTLFTDLMNLGKYSALIYDGAGDAEWLPSRIQNFQAVSCSRTGPAYAVTTGGNLVFTGHTSATMIAGGTIRSYFTASAPYMSNLAESAAGIGGSDTRYMALRFGDATVGGAGYPACGIRTTDNTDININAGSEFYGALTGGPARYWVGSTWDGATLTLYVDGVARASTAAAGTLDHTQPMYLGASPDWGVSGGFRALDGTVEDCRLYLGRCLSADAMWRLYQESLFGYQEVLRWVQRDAGSSTSTTALVEVPWIYRGGSPDPSDPFNFDAVAQFGNPTSPGTSPPPPPPPPPPGGGGGGTRHKGFPQVPRDAGAATALLRRHTETVADILNSLSRKGRIVQVAGGFDIRPGFVEPRAPTVTDDADAGCFIGAVWINTATNEFYVCFGVANGAAVWRGPF